MNGTVTRAAGQPGKARLRVLGGLLALLLIVVVILGGVGWFGSERALNPGPPHYAWSLADFPDLKFEPVRFPSRTGITLAGRFFPGSNGATIVLSHGYGDEQDQMLPWANFLHQAGFNVLTYDMRHRGQSGGRYVTVGALEPTDLVSAVDYLVSRPDVDPNRIGAFGISLGGSTTIMAAARDPRIKAVVDDCGFSDASNVISSSFKHFVHLPPFPFAPVTVRIAEWRSGQDVHDVRPVAEIGRISPRPIFIIHGAADTAVPPDNSQRNFAAAGEPKQIWLVEGATHAHARDVAGPEYDLRVTDFFKQSLAGA